MEFDLSTIDWYMELIKDEKKEINKLKEIRDGRIKKLKESYKEKADKIQSNIDSKMESIRNYLIENDIKMKKAKTQTKFEGLSGNFIIKYPKSKIKYNKKKLLQKAISECKTEYIKSKTKQSFDWAKYKKNLEIRDDKVINKNTGEVISMLSVEVEPERWEVK